MLKKYLDFSVPTESDSLFNIDPKRRLEIEIQLEDICDDIGTNYEEYILQSSCGHSGCFRLHVGKCLSQIIDIPQDEREELFLAYCFKTFLDNCKVSINYFKSIDVSNL